jgi:nucleotide-binding universal stress UspA family protein
MFHRILIPLDGSILAERAIPHAERFARIFNASIVLLRVLDVSSDENPDIIDPITWQIRKAEAELYLQGVAARIRDHLRYPENNPGNETANNARVEYAIREGRTADNIIDFAHNEKIDLLVISSHGSGGVSRWNMSSVIQKVMDMVYLPLLIVRSFGQQEETSDQIHYRRILLPVDSSRRAECVLPAATLLAQGEKRLESMPDANLSETNPPSPEPMAPDSEPSEARLYLAAVIKPPEIPIPKPYPVEVGKLSDQLLEVSRQAVHAYLHTMQLRLPVESDIRVTGSSNVASAVQQVADQDRIDLIVISAHGNTEQLTVPYGNVTRNIMEHNTKSILVIQDIPQSQVPPTAAAAAAEKSGEQGREPPSPAYEPNFTPSPSRTNQTPWPRQPN